MKEKRFDFGSFFDMVLNTAAAIIATKLMQYYAEDLFALENVARSCVLGACFGFLSLNIMCGLLRFLALLTGPFELPRLMDDPANSATLREFWGQRWDSVLQELLKEYIYLPMRRRGYSRSSSSACTFFASGLGHTLPIFCGLKDVRMMGAMLGYFLVQLILLTIQNLIIHRINVIGSIKGLLSWGATMSLVLIPAPLFVLPALCLAKLCPPNPVEVFYKREFWMLYIMNVFYLLVFVKVIRGVLFKLRSFFSQPKPTLLKKD